MSSSVDHRHEAAAQWLEAELAGKDVPPLLAIIGLSDVAVLSAIERRAPATRVLALEPNAGLASRFLAQPDVQRWRAAGRLAYLVDPDYAGADEAWRVFPSDPDAHKLIVRPDVARDGGPAAIRAARAYKQIYFGARANADARRKFAPGYLAGSLHNLPEILAGQDIRGLADAYRGLPAIIAAAGPSLDAVLDDLAATRDRAVVIAADTALRPLLAHGLPPELVVAVDPQPVNARHFHELPPCPETWLVSEGSIDPSVIAPFGDRAYWFRVSNHEPWSWYNELGIDVGQIDVWGSVVTAAFQVAVLAGCDPIVFVGTDLSFTRDRPYCRGTTYEFDWAHLAADGQTRDQAWRAFLRVDEQIRVPDVHGRETATTPSMQSFRDWLVARARRCGRRVINATGAGIFAGDGIEQLALGDALTTSRRIPSPRVLPRAAVTTTPRAEVGRRLWDVHRVVCRNGQATAPLDRWKEFCGEGFDLVAVGAAVERAARVLERPDAAPVTSRTTIPWSELGSAGATRSVLRRMPEAMTRFRTALTTGTLPPAPHDSAAATECLAAAFEILCSLCRAAEGGADEAAPVPAGHVGRLPLGASYYWPIASGRAVRLAEALLGEAWPASPLPRPAESSYFTRCVALRDASREASVGPTPHQLACAALAIEWWLCASYLAAASEPARAQVAARWRGFVDALATPPAPVVTGTPVSLVVGAGADVAIELPLPVGDAALSRLLTGSAIVQHGAGTLATPLITLASSSTTQSLAVRAGRASVHTTRRPMVTPRVLTDEGVARAVLPYSTGATARCTVLRGAESFIVREDGSTEPGLVWPKPATGELPFGDGGAIAWNVGPSARWPEGGPGYVMYRRTADATPAIETLPFAPQVGTWWRDRFYWICFPFGVGSWAPGVTPDFALPNRMLFSVLADERGLVLGPRSRTSDGAAERRLITEGWSWQPGQDPQSVSLGPLGVTSARTSAHGWHAAAHPEADAIELRREDGTTVTMTCYYPFGVAWAGRSLLVSTVDGELLFFERFTDVLEDWTGDRR